MRVAVLLLAALAVNSSPASTPAPTPAPAPAPTSTLTPDSARFDTDAALTPHADDVVDYTFRASLDPDKHTVHGDGTITWRNTSSVPVHELWVHLYLNAFKNQKSVWLREPVTGARGMGGVSDWGAIDVRKLALRDDAGAATDLWPGAEIHRPGDDDETDARVPLPRDVAPGERIKLDVTWDDKLPTVVERTGYLGHFHMVGQWFPKIARLEPDGRWAHFPFHHLAEFYADYGTYDVTLDVPQGFAIGATGPAIDTRVDGGRRVERHVQADVHDFAWTAWDQWQQEKEVIDGVRVSVLYPPSYRVDAQRELRSIRFALPWFNAHYGRYPYEVLTLVHPPHRAAEAGGMEYPTLITTGGPWYGPPGVFEIEATTVHELGHEWFYGLVGTNEVDWPFLDEGLNSFAETSSMGAWLGPSSASDLLGLELSDAVFHASLQRHAGHDAPIAQPAYAFQGADYGALVYARTSAIFETLRRSYGDEPVYRALGRYARKYRFQHPVPDDLIATFGEVMGEKVAHTLRTALFDLGWVDYTLAEINCAPAHEAGGLFDRGGKRETLPGQRAAGFEGSVLVVRRGTLSFPVDVDLIRVDGSTQRVRWDGESSEIRIPYASDVALASAVIDPDHAIMLDESLVNNGGTAPRQPMAGAPRTFERALYWAEIAMQSVLP